MYGMRKDASTWLYAYYFFLSFLTFYDYSMHVNGDRYLSVTARFQKKTGGLCQGAL